MTAASRDFNVSVRENSAGMILPMLLAASVTGYKNALAVVNSAGYVEAASVGTSSPDKRCIGVFAEQVIGAASAGVTTAKIRTNCIVYFDNDSTSPVAITHIGKQCYLLDDRTVAYKPAALGRVAGTVVDVSATLGVGVLLTLRGHEKQGGFEAGPALSYTANAIALTPTPNTMYAVPTSGATGNVEITLTGTNLRAGDMICFTDAGLATYTVTFKEGSTAIGAAIAAGKKATVFIVWTGSAFSYIGTEA